MYHIIACFDGYLPVDILHVLVFGIVKAVFLGVCQTLAIQDDGGTKILTQLSLHQGGCDRHHHHYWHSHHLPMVSHG